MPVKTFDLEKLLAPIGQERFFRDYWERQALAIPRDDPDCYTGLLTTADVDQVIAFTRPKFVDGSAFSKGTPRQQTYVQGWLADRQPQENSSPPGIAELQSVYARGKTVVIMAMQHRWLPFAVLCRNLEGVFHCPVHANMYLTPGGAQGFDAHFDTHEVLVLQLEGSKHWRLYGPARRFPSVEDRFDGPKDTLGPAREVVLQPGDLLYLPRGHVHEAFTSECSSLHVTVGINVFRWADLFHEALATLTRNDERFRESIPPGLLGGEQLSAHLKMRFQELLDVVTRTARAEEGLRGLGDQFFGALQPLPNASFLRPEEKSIDLDTVLEKSPGAICRVVQEGGWIVIEFPGGQVGGPLKIASALHFVARNERFAVRSLPDDLGAEAKLLLARRLLLERLLEVAEQPPAGTRSANNVLHSSAAGT